MKDFQYAAPRTEADVVGLLSPERGKTEILAGGTDLIGLMKKMVVTPSRVVNVMDVASMKGIQADSLSVTIGAVTTLDEVLDAPELAAFPGIGRVIRNISSIQLQSQGTIGGELCQRPHCWYFRNGQGLTADNGRAVEQGVNRLHAILGNRGPAKFVHASRLAPMLMALGAEVRVAGPGDSETWLPLDFFYRTPRSEHQRETVLEPNQVLTHIKLPKAEGISSAAYEVRHGAGPDAPLAAAAHALRMEGGIVREAKIVMGHVAPTPWFSPEATQSILGQPVTPETAQRAGEAAVALATPLSENGYKVQLARTAVKRAVLLAAGLETGGF